MLTELGEGAEKLRKEKLGTAAKEVRATGTPAGEGCTRRVSGTENLTSI